MEDYKKKYEHALERARNIRFGNPQSGTANVVCEEIFPELKESEDERIRKYIIKHFQEHLDACKRFTNDGMFPPFSATEIKMLEASIAWLEKQGKQIPKWIQWTGKNLKEVIDFTGKSVRFNEWFKSWDEYETYVHSHGDIFKLFCIDGSHYEVPVGAWIIKTPDGYNVPSRFKFIQKSTELDEEDEKMINSIIKNLDEGEWLDIYQVDWLKSLKERYTWKPSDKQMYYLSWVANVKLGDSVVEQEVSKHLNELLEDLKKLK